MKKAFILCSFLIALIGLASCGSSSSEQKGDDSTATAAEVKPTYHVELDSLHSMMKMKDSVNVPVYTIVSADSFYIEMKNYEFPLSAPEFDYIRENINYKEMVVTASSFAYVNIISDGKELRYDTVSFKKSEDNNSILVKIKDKNVKDFLLAFRFYIDNGKGRQEIDRFRVKVASK